MVISLWCVSVQELHIMILSMFAPTTMVHCILLFTFALHSSSFYNMCSFNLYSTPLQSLLCAMFWSVHFALPSSNVYIPLIYALRSFNFALP